MKQFAGKLKNRYQNFKHAVDDVRAPGEKRQKKKPRYRSLRLQRKIRPSKYKPLPNFWRLWQESLRTFRTHKKPILIFVLVYGLFYLLFVRGLSSGISIGDVKTTLQDLGGKSVGHWVVGASLFGLLLTTANATNSQSAATYQVILVIMGSLALVWLLRRLSEAKSSDEVSVKQAFYQGMQPIVPFLGVVVVLALELIPFAIAAYLFNTVIINGLASSALEMAIFALVTFLMMLLSLYLLCGSIAAIYIVTLPGAPPINSIRVSHRLLSIHRWSVLRKVVLMCLSVALVAAIIFIPLLILIPASWSWIAEYVFFACSVLAFTIIHIYLFTLYRSLL